MQFTVYILFSPSKDKYYVGYTGDDLNERIRRHNTNHRGFTGRIGDWQICYTENSPPRPKQFKEKVKLKNGRAGKKLNCLLEFSSINLEHPDYNREGRRFPNYIGLN